MDKQDLKTEHQLEREKKERLIYDDFKELYGQPGAMKTKVYAVLMKKYNIKSSTTIWSMIDRVKKRLHDEQINQPA